MKKLFEKIAVPNLAFYVTIVFAVGFVVMLFDRGIQVYTDYLVFDAQKVLQGQIWRIITTLFYPPLGIGSLSQPTTLLLGALGIFIYYNFSSAVERIMGEAEFNLYFFGSILIGEIGTVLYYLYLKNIYGIVDIPVYFLPTYAHFSVFMAFAILYPEAKVLLFFIIPLKIKWVAIAELALYIYRIITENLYTKIMVICALIPILIFFLRNLRKNSGEGGIIGRIRFRMKQKQRQKEWKEQWKN